jgi:hypothetical protein
MRPQQLAHGLHRHHGHSQANHHKQRQGIDYPSPSSVGTCKPAWNPVPLKLASIPEHAWYIKKLRSNPCLWLRFCTFYLSVKTVNVLMLPWTSAGT